MCVTTTTIRIHPHKKKRWSERNKRKRRRCEERKKNRSSCIIRADEIRGTKKKLALGYVVCPY